MSHYVRMLPINIDTNRFYRLTLKLFAKIDYVYSDNRTKHKRLNTLNVKADDALAFQSLLVITTLASNNCTLRPHCIYVFCIYLRQKQQLVPLTAKLIGFYNRDEKCLQRGTDWVFKLSRSENKQQLTA